MHFSLCFFAAKSIQFFFSFLFILLKWKGIFLLLGLHQIQDLGCPIGSATNKYSTTFCSSYTKMPEHHPGCLFRMLMMEWLTDVADDEMLVEIHSLMNNFIEDFLKLRN